jgi:hypothetical protein
MVAAGFQSCFWSRTALRAVVPDPPRKLLVWNHGDCQPQPSSDNAVKCYWSSGGQLLLLRPGSIDRVMEVSDIQRADFDQAVATGK